MLKSNNAQREEIRESVANIEARAKFHGIEVTTEYKSWNRDWADVKWVTIKVTHPSIKNQDNGNAVLIDYDARTIKERDIKDNEISRVHDNRDFAIQNQWEDDLSIEPDNIKHFINVLTVAQSLWEALKLFPSSLIVQAFEEQPTKHE